MTLITKLVAGLIVAACIFATVLHSSQSVTHSQLVAKQGEAASMMGAPEVSGKLIWRGSSNNIRIIWTTADLFVESTVGKQGIWQPLAKAGFEDFVSSQEPGYQPPIGSSCIYERDFEILAVVGPLVSFVDRESEFCGGAHPGADTRFTTIDLRKAGKLSYTRGANTSGMDVDPAQPEKIVKLTDYFREEDVLRALLKDPIIKKALVSEGAMKPPQTLMEFSKLFATNDHELGESGYELRPDFLTRFAFHHIQNNQVAVRIGLSPYFGFNRTFHLQLGLLLPLPQKLEQALAGAASGHEGFLMKDAAKISRGRSTLFKFTVK